MSNQPKQWSSPPEQIIDPQMDVLFSIPPRDPQNPEYPGVKIRSISISKE